MSDTETRRIFDGKYISLETYRRSGDPVRTTVWFVEHAGALMIRTHQDSWKAKRMRAQEKVRVTVSSFSGKERGEWIRMLARPARPEEVEPAERLFVKKYRFQKWATGVASSLSGKRYVFFVLEPHRSEDAPR